MKVRDAGLFLFGGMLVYVAVAACSSGAVTGTRTSGTGANVGSSGTNGRDSGLMDALGNPVPDASADPVSGARLKAQFMLADDGSKEYVPGVWWDSMRNEQCTFSTGGDGKVRCIPAGSGASAFSDSSCTMPIVAVATGCTTPTYALVVDTATCGGGGGDTHIHAVGAAANPTTLYLSSGGQCFQAGTATAGYNYFSIGAEVPPTSFVSGATQHD